MLPQDGGIRRTLKRAQGCFSGTDFKMVLHDAQIDVGISDYGEQRLGFDSAVLMQDELELLLVDGRRCQQGCLHSSHKPSGYISLRFEESFYRPERMLHALGGSIAQSYHAMDDVIPAKGKRSRDFSSFSFPLGPAITR